MTKKIIVVDDDKVIAKAISFFFVKKGFSTHIFFEPEGALEYFLRNEADLILVDHDMPGMNGPNLVSKIKKIRSGIICIGMSADKNNADAFYSAGCCDFLQKPFGREQLERILRTLKSL